MSLRDAAEAALKWMVASWHQIDNEWGPSNEEPDDEPAIKNLRDALAEALESGKRKCHAIQHSDQMVCEMCGIAWDVNDPCEPGCKPVNAEKAEPEVQVQRESVKSATQWRRIKIDGVWQNWKVLNSIHAWTPHAPDDKTVEYAITVETESKVDKRPPAALPESAELSEEQILILWPGEEVLGERQTSKATRSAVLYFARAVLAAARGSK